MKLLPDNQIGLNKGLQETASEITFQFFEEVLNIITRWSKVHLSRPVAKADVRSKAVVLLLLTFCLLLLQLWESVIVLCFVVRYFMSILVLQSSWWGRESWLLCLICLPGVSWWLSGSSSRYHGVVCSLWLWYFLIILIYYFCSDNFQTIWYDHYALTSPRNL